MPQHHHKAASWATEVPSFELNRKSVNALLENRVPAIILSGFLFKADCDQLVHGLNHAGMSRYTHVTSKVLKFGPVQAECNSAGKKEHYFELVRYYTPKVDHLFKEIENPPLEFLMKKFSELFQAEANLAHEPVFGDYFAGTFRNIQGPGFIHFDFAAEEAPGWAISEIDAQLSWNLYLNDDFEDGELTVHETQWSTESETYKIPNCYSYSSGALLKRSKNIVYKPKQGDLVLFNSRNFHEIAAPSAPRLTQSSFIGLRKNGSFWFWS